jgi:hypothetical protein
MAIAVELFDAGVAAACAKDYGTARQCLVQAIKNEPRNEQAWLWLSKVMPTVHESLRCIDHLLTINPTNGLAREAREILQIRLLLEEAGVRKASPTLDSPRQRRYLLGEALVEAGVITQQQLQSALQHQTQQSLMHHPKSLGEILVQLRFVQHDELAAALAAQVESAMTRTPSSGIGRIGEYLNRRGLLTTAQLHQALARQARMQKNGAAHQLGDVIVAMGYIPRVALNKALLEWHEEFDRAFL